MKTNLLLLADAYKYSHYKLYYPGTTKIYSYLESRGGEFNETVFYGLQYFLKEYLEGVAFTKTDIDELEEIMGGVFVFDKVFNRANFEYILEKQGGKLPVRIKAVPEGSVIPTHNVLMTIENTDPKCFWLTNFLETLLMQVWYPSTVTTLSREIRKVVEANYRKTADPQVFAGIDFTLNDFGFRGVSSVESAGLGGSAHLVNFMGSDTVYASAFAKKYYDAVITYGQSIPATEHSIMTLLGKDGEQKVFEHILNAYPNGMVACVSDSYDIFNAIGNLWGGALKDKVMNRNGVLVVRPDSGDPIMTLQKIFELLFEKFGFEVNTKGYKVLPPQIRVIQGDGIDYEMIKNIYAMLEKNKIAANNLVFGMGGALLQKLNRDTQKFALKCSYAEVDGKSVDVMKSPVEMDEKGAIQQSFKKSKAGRLKLVQTLTGVKTVKESEVGEDLLRTVFENGELVNPVTFEEIRDRAKISNMAFALN
jgi:nicotinamide phosphoribosyltransferase